MTSSEGYFRSPGQAQTGATDRELASPVGSAGYSTLGVRNTGLLHAATKNGCLRVAAKLAMRAWGWWARRAPGLVLLLVVPLSLAGTGATAARGRGDTWAPKASKGAARAGLGVAAAANGKLYAIGGFNGGFLPPVEESDPATNTWAGKASMPTARSGFGVAAAA